MEIYAVGFDRFVKIGMTANLARRVAAIQTGCPLPLQVYHRLKVGAAVAPHIERRAHHLLASHRLSGEWFEAPPEAARQAIIQSVSDLEAGIGAPRQTDPRLRRSRWLSEEEEVEAYWAGSLHARSPAELRKAAKEHLA